MKDLLASNSAGQFAMGERREGETGVWRWEAFLSPSCIPGYISLCSKNVFFINASVTYFVVELSYIFPPSAISVYLAAVSSPR